MMENDFSEKAVELGKMLKQIYNNENFITGVLGYVLESDEDMQKIIDFINKDEDVDIETISVLAMDLCDAREQNQITKALGLLREI